MKVLSCLVSLLGRNCICGVKNELALISNTTPADLRGFGVVVGVGGWHMFILAASEQRANVITSQCLQVLFTKVHPGYQMQMARTRRAALAFN